MSVDYYVSAGVGWKLDFTQTQDFFASFKRQLRPEVSHLQPRFDPNTGEKLNPRLVIDRPAEYGYIVGNDQFALNDEELVCVLNKYLQSFKLVPIHNYDGDIALIVSLNVESVEEGTNVIDTNEEHFLEFFLPDNIDDLIHIAREELKTWFPPTLEFGRVEIIAGVTCSG
jgi:hypothetical protein